jgi:hypothetical protein
MPKTRVYLICIEGQKKTAISRIVVYFLPEVRIDQTQILWSQAGAQMLLYYIIFFVKECIASVYSCLAMYAEQDP